MSNQCAIIGVGMTPFGKFPDKSVRELAQSAITAALGDAGASVLLSGDPEGQMEHSAIRATKAAYEQAGVSPTDVHVVELHDASAPAELMYYETLGLCPAGQGPALLRSGATGLNGKVSVNPSGGLLSKGHPIAATGAAQIVELTQQLRGQSGPRQREGARVALAENAGGSVGQDGAAAVATILHT